MRRINVNLFPKDGYFFKEKDGTIIRASSSWRGVVARVIAYRKRNNLALGNATEEVHAQACERNPEACQDVLDGPTRQALKVATLKGRVLAWLGSMRARSRELLFGDEKNMRARAAVCLNCPAHATIAGGCGSCKKAVRAVRQELLGPRPIDERLSGCSVLNEDCAISTWIDQPTVDNPELPGCCWRRKSPPA